MLQMEDYVIPLTTEVTSVLTQIMKKIAHIGIAVASLQEAIPLYRDLLGFSYLGTEEVESEKVRVAFFQIGESHLELLEGMDEESPISKFIAKKGEGLHHVAFSVEGIEERLQEIKDKGIALIHEQPKLGAHGTKIAFLHPKSTVGVLMELCEEQRI
jgi:methylmalonyl-CoA/ethylmalonyl-CoA epimerase